MHHPEKSKRQPSRYSKKWLFIIGCIVLLCVGLFGFLRWRMPYLTCFGTLFPSHADVERQAAIEWPASVESIDYDAYEPDPGCSFQVSFEMNAEDLEAFQTSTVTKDFVTVNMKNEAILHALKPWDWVQSADSVLLFSGVYTIPHFAQQIFIDTTNPDTFAVYIYAWREYP